MPPATASGADTGPCALGRAGAPLVLPRPTPGRVAASAGRRLPGSGRPHWRAWRAGRRLHAQSYAQRPDRLVLLPPVVLAVLASVAVGRLGVAAEIDTAPMIVAGGGRALAARALGRPAAVPAFAALGLVGAGDGLGEAVRTVAVGTRLLPAVAFVTGHVVG